MSTELKRNFVHKEGECPNGKRRRIKSIRNGINNRHFAADADDESKDTRKDLPDKIHRIYLSRPELLAHQHQSPASVLSRGNAKKGFINATVQGATRATVVVTSHINEISPAFPDDDKKQVSLDYCAQRDFSKEHHYKPRRPAIENIADEDELSCLSSSSSRSSEESSLMSSCSDESEDGKEPMPSLHVRSKYQGLQRLEKKLALRKERLKHLCVGQPPAYVHLIERNEEIARNIKIAKYKEQHPDEDATLVSKPMLPKNKAIDSFQGILQFEGLHTVPCAVTVFIICLGHSAFFGFVECLCRIAYHSFLKQWIAENKFYIILIFVGLLLLRFNGGLFFYARDRAYNLIKIEMSNRLKVGMFDARIFKLIKGSMTYSSFNMFGYYLICIGINHFYEGYLYVWMDQHSAWIDGIWSRAVDLANTERIQKQNRCEHFYPLLDCVVSAPNEDISPSCEVATEIVSHPVLKYLYNFWCNDVSNEYKSIEIIFHWIWLLLSACFAIHAGQNLMTYCD